MKRIFVLLGLVLTAGIAIVAFRPAEEENSWIRINQLGYTPAGVKVAIWCSKQTSHTAEWQLIDAATKKIATSGKMENEFGKYGPFAQTIRINFSSFNKSGRYYLQAGKTKSPEFNIGDDVYKGAADFCLRYMRQQRTGFNPYLKDSCHTRDGYVLYGKSAGIADSTYIDVVGGWHDASDYLQYMTTSANATWHLLAAYRDFPNVFTDEKQANGLDGKNEIPDVLDEAKWGLDWLVKMHPRSDWMFNQIGDDRDHISMRIPKEDTQYGKGNQRPVYFIDGLPQQRGKFMNDTKGTSSTAAKLASAFALAQYLGKHDKKAAFLNKEDDFYLSKAISSYLYSFNKLGVTQTVSVRSPYIYAEENYVDDMELAAAQLIQLADTKPGIEIADKNFYIKEALDFAREEKTTPWLGSDTASHYQWYPFINLGHYETARILGALPGVNKKADKPHEYYASKEIKSQRDTLIGYYREGIEKVWAKSKSNAFYRGVPFIWCSNNLTVAFAMQCYWYRQLTGDNKYAQLEQANLDWLFGCNPWGTSMVYGLPSWGDTPVDPHSAFTHLKKYPIDGGLVDGPVYTNIYKNLIGIKLMEPDEYEPFQSDLAVYHDDYGDYSTNEPTMDGTASLIYLLAAKEAEANKTTMSHGAIIRGDSTQRRIALVFTGDEFADGGDKIATALKKQNALASFFFTGKFYRNDAFKKLIDKLKADKHYLGPHSDQHLLYCDWSKRDSLLVTQDQFRHDLDMNYEAMHAAGIRTQGASIFLPPYEWYNDKIAQWTNEAGLQLINFTPGTRSNADYTWPGLAGYRSSDEIYRSIVDYEARQPTGLNGFILLLHIGTDPRRTDKFYDRLPGLLKYLKGKGYQFQTVNQLLDKR